MENRRKFERIKIADSAHVFVTTKDERVLGPVRLLGRGGFMVVTGEEFAPGQRHTLKLVDEREGIQRQVECVVRSVAPEGTGFEFAALDDETAVEVGVIIGRHYSPGATTR